MTRRDAMIQALHDADLPVTFIGDEAQAAYARLVDDWVEQGLVQSESFEEEVQRLRDRIHNAVDECQDRMAPYVSRCEKFDVWSEWAREHFARMDDNTWTHGSEANRLLIMSLIEERDKAVDEVKRLKIERANESLQWLLEDDHYDLMRAYAPDVIKRLHAVLEG
jgi:hypothetical protein